MYIRHVYTAERPQVTEGQDIKWLDEQVTGEILSSYQRKVKNKAGSFVLSALTCKYAMQ